MSKSFKQFLHESKKEVNESVHKDMEKELSKVSGSYDLYMIDSTSLVYHNADKKDRKINSAIANVVSNFYSDWEVNWDDRETMRIRYSNPVNESQVNEGREYRDTMEFTEDYDTVWNILHSRKFESWMRDTGTAAVRAHMKVKQAMQELQDAIDDFDGM